MQKSNEIDKRNQLKVKHLRKIVATNETDKMTKRQSYIWPYS